MAFDRRSTAVAPQAVYWPGDKGPWHTTYDKKPLNGQVTRWQVWTGEDGARRRVLG